MIANVLVENATKKPLCFNRQPSLSAKYMANVVTEFFVGEVQLKLNELMRRYRQLMPA